MRKNVIVTIVLALFLLAGIAFAADTDPAASDTLAQNHLKASPAPGKGPAKGQGKSPVPQGPMKMRMHMNPMHMRQMAMKSFFLMPPAIMHLGLTEQQIATLEKMRDDHAKRTIDAKAEIAKQGVDLRTLMNAKDLDINAIQAKLQQIANLKVQMQVANLRAFEQAKGVLTPDQKKKFDDMMRMGPPMDRKVMGEESMEGPGPEAAAFEGEPAGPPVD